MPASDKTARALALEVLLAHFPNSALVARGIEQVYGKGIARELPRQMQKLKRELQNELRKVNSTKKTIDRKC